ncbi:parallel beta-helix repeat protein [Vibrio phage 1.210.O._10N.222.52.C2]|nr:parallel beta-helix repeat protein [Vibrio phage 1.210.O._10N.222.52.C2]
MASIDIPNACSTSANEPVGTTSLEAASCNLSFTDRFANTTDLTVTNRVGLTQDSVSGIQAKGEAVINELGASFGFIIQGDFSTGFTITNRNQVGQAVDGTIWRYTGEIPDGGFIVAPGTTPSSPTYNQLVETDHNELTNRNAADAHDEIYNRSFDGVTQMLAYTSLSVGTRYSTGGTTWEYLGNTSGDISDFKPLSVVFAADFGVRTGLDASAIVASIAENFTNIELPTGELLWQGNGIISPLNNLTIYGNATTVRISRLAGKGDYAFMAGTADNVEVHSIDFIGSGVLPTQVNDPLDTFQRGLITLQGDNHKIHNINITDYWGYYNFFDFWHNNINIIGGGNHRLHDIVILNSGHEGIGMGNVHDSFIQRLHYSNDNSLFTALKVFPINDENDVTTCYENTLRDIYVRGAIGSSVDIGGIGSYCYNHRYDECRKGLNLDNEQFPDQPAVGEHKKIRIRGLEINGNNAADGYGLLITSAVKGDDIKVFDTTVKNINGGSFSINGFNDITVDGVDIETSFVGESIRVAGQSTNPTGKASVKNIVVNNSTDYTGEGAAFRFLSKITINDMELTDIGHVRFTTVDNIKIKRSSIDGFNGISIQISSPNEVSFKADDLTIDCGTTISTAHIRYVGTLTPKDITVKNSSFSDTTNSYAIDFGSNAATGRVNSYNNTANTTATLVFPRASGITVHSVNNDRGFESAINFGSGYLWVDSTGVVRTSVTSPTSDLAGVVVGSQT